MQRVKLKLSFMMFLEWFIWGAWFVPLWRYLNELGFSATQIAWSYSSTGIAAIVSPVLVGVIADRYYAAQKVLTVVKDTIGAGDSHAAGVLAGLSAGWGLRDAIMLGNAIAAYVVGQTGGDNSPSVQQLRIVLAAV